MKRQTLGSTVSFMALGLLLGLVVETHADAQCVLGTIEEPVPAYAELGRAVATDGDWVIATDPVGNRAVVYRRDGIELIPNTVLEPSDGFAEGYGTSVALGDDLIVVGVPQDSEAGVQAGAAYVYRYDGVQWNEETKLLASDPDAGDYFGRAVALSGARVLVTAPSDDEAAPNAGAAYFYVHNGFSWFTDGKRFASNPAANDQFGISADMSDNVAVIGSLYGDGLLANTGVAYVFRDLGSGWEQSALLDADDGLPGDGFGLSVSLSSPQLAAIGAPGNTPGAIYIFRALAPGIGWLQTKQLFPFDGNPDALSFGAALTIRGGDLLVAGPNDDDMGWDAGAVYRYRYEGALADWTIVEKLYSSSPSDQAYFGSDVSLAGPIAAVGAPRYLTDGLADVFAVAGDDCNENEIADLCDIASGSSTDLDDDEVPDECGVVFSRGDCNNDAFFDIGDGIYLLNALFVGGPPAPCPVACDANDDGSRDIGDVIYMLNRLFVGGPPILPPHPECGPDPTPDSLPCTPFVACP